MKKTNILMLIAVLLTGFLLNVHIIRLEDGTEFITKDNMSFRETYVDARDWSMGDYLAHSSRIRNYLIYEKHYPELVSDISESAESLKHKLRRVEEAAHQWVSEKLR